MGSIKKLILQEQYRLVIESENRKNGKFLKSNYVAILNNNSVLTSDICTILDDKDIKYGLCFIFYKFNEPQIYTVCVIVDRELNILDKIVEDGWSFTITPPSKEIYKYSHSNEYIISNDKLNLNLSIYPEEYQIVEKFSLHWNYFQQSKQYITEKEMSLLQKQISLEETIELLEIGMSQLVAGKDFLERQLTQYQHLVKKIEEAI